MSLTHQISVGLYNYVLSVLSDGLLTSQDTGISDEV